MTLDLADLGSLAEKAGSGAHRSRDRTRHREQRGGTRVQAERQCRQSSVMLSSGHKADEDPVAREAGSLALRHLEIGARLQDQEALTRRVATARSRTREAAGANGTIWSGAGRCKSSTAGGRLRNRLKRKPGRRCRRFGRSTSASNENSTTILETHQDAAGIVVYPPTIGWAAQLFQRPQQMARAFARMGYLTFFGVDWGGEEKVEGLSVRGGSVVPDRASGRAPFDPRREFPIP